MRHTWVVDRMMHLKLRTSRSVFRLIALRFSAVVVLGSALPATGLAQKPAADLTQVSLEDLMNIEVTSVSRKEQKLSKTGAAVYVISQEDIRRSGATNIPDLLRMAPGVNVARVNASAWAISIRGFNDRYADKVLVLIDGRSVYTPTFSGVYWDQQDVPLENIERIEIIRGPGGAVWGANAMNGVINIITKKAEATQGGLIAAVAGTESTAYGLVQYGGNAGVKGTYRVFGKYFNAGNSTFSKGLEAADGWRMARGGFRSDWNLSPRDSVTVQGDLFNGNEGQTTSTLISNDLYRQVTFDERISVSGGNLLGRWNRNFANGSGTSLQVYYDNYSRSLSKGYEKLNTFDLDFQHHLVLGSRHDIVWGAGYRVASDGFTPGYSTTVIPARRTTSLFSTFIQDEFTITNSVSLTLGSKFEHNAYTGFEFEPTARLVWAITGRQAIWASASRAIRQPSRAESGLLIDIAALPLPGGGLGVVQLRSNPLVQAEQLRDYETGYRAQVSKQVSLDISTFLDFYRHLSTSQSESPFFAASPLPPHLVLPLVIDYKARARTYGAEVFLNWNVNNRWRISPGYSMINMHAVNGPSISRNTPSSEAQLRSFLILPHNLNWDSSLSYVGRLTNGNIPSYTRVDSRIGWRMGESAEFSIVGQNLLSPRHNEFGFIATQGNRPTEVQRSVFGRITWRF